MSENWFSDSRCIGGAYLGLCRGVNRLSWALVVAARFSSPPREPTELIKGYTDRKLGFLATEGAERSAGEAELKVRVGTSLDSAGRAATFLAAVT